MELAVTSDLKTIVCYHPSLEIPYEHTKVCPNVHIYTSYSHKGISSSSFWGHLFFIWNIDVLFSMWSACLWSKRMINIAAAMSRTLFLVKLKESCRVRNAQISQHVVTQTELNEAFKYLCTTEKTSVCLWVYSSGRMFETQIMVHTSYCVQMPQSRQEVVKECCCCFNLSFKFHSALWVHKYHKEL